MNVIVGRLVGVKFGRNVRTSVGTPIFTIVTMINVLDLGLTLIFVR